MKKDLSDRPLLTGKESTRFSVPMPAAYLGTWFYTMKEDGQQVLYAQDMKTGVQVSMLIPHHFNENYTQREQRDLIHADAIRLWHALWNKE